MTDASVADAMRYKTYLFCTNNLQPPVYKASGNKSIERLRPTATLAEARQIMKMAKSPPQFCLAALEQRASAIKLADLKAHPVRPAGSGFPVPPPIY
ncbi:hypothetical protein PoB_004784300 [Plakobranchus ocellatus]|uniref:Uncharacterized protein n=1 Tax=Plakobranchus ocellatus TaxID=259542 RepID=A0AAV4BP34_9GAST|nr:hypothetical protein PoB_004784300 [Plakobranchus ocellatus]